VSPPGDGRTYGCQPEELGLAFRQSETERITEQGS
jgi:hypothetical protein